MIYPTQQADAPIKARYFNDPGCPWGYCWRPAHARLLWRFGGQIQWDLRMIGLSEDPSHYERKGITPARMAAGLQSFRERFGMPFSLTVKPRMAGTARACRAVIAVGQERPDLADAALRCLQLMHFTTRRLLDVDDEIRQALSELEGIDADRVVSRIDDPDILEAYRSDHASARSAAGGPAEAQGRHAAADGAARYTAPSVVFEHVATGRLAEIGGFQSYGTCETALVNLDPSLQRHPVPGTAAEALRAFPHGLTTAEVAAVMRSSELALDDQAAAERELIELADAGEAICEPMGGDALWQPTIGDRAEAGAGYEAGLAASR